MSWSNDLIAEFLTLYEQEPMIWNPKHEGHKDRNVVHDAWMRIQRTFSNTCTISDLKKKKETLMGTFRKLHSKVKASRKTGTSADKIFKPDWFAYEQMVKFLQSVYSPRETKSSEEQSDTEYRDNEIQNETFTNVDLSENSASITVANTSTSNIFEAPTSAKVLDNKKRKIDIAAKETRMEEAYNYLKAMRDKPDEDECSSFSELLCHKLRALDKNMRDIAKHEIDCLMFRFKQQQHSLEPVRYFQQLVSPFQSHTQRFPVIQSSHYQPFSGYPTFPYPRSQSSPEFPPSPQSHSQPSPGFPPSPQSHSQSSPGFSPSPHSHSQPPPGFPPSPQSHFQPSPGFPPSPHSHSQPSPGYQPSPHSHSQPSPGFPPFPHSHSQPSPGYQPSPHSHSQPSPGFPPSPHSHSEPSPGYQPSHSHSQPSPGFPPSPQSHSQSSPGFPPSPHSHSQPSPGFSPSPQSHSQPSSEYPFSRYSHSQPCPIVQQSSDLQSHSSTHCPSQPSPIVQQTSHPQSQPSPNSLSQPNIQHFSDEAYEDTLDSMLQQ